MATMKYKMCGGDLEVTAGMTVAECEYCGSLLGGLVLSKYGIEYVDDPATGKH